jgi:DNA-binding transcriptional LysR family regulator
MTKQQLEYFLSAAEFCNLSKAANFHYVSIPTFTRHINDLEAELSTRLFDRNNRGLVMTTAGALFHSFARDTLTRMYEYYDEILGRGLLVGEPHDEFVMGYYPFGGMFSQYAKLIDRYLHIWIKKPCVLHCIKGGRMTDMVRRGDLDVGTVSISQLDKYGNDFESRVFFESKCTLLVDPEHELASRDSITVDELVERYSAFSLYLPEDVAAPELRERAITGARDVIELTRRTLDFLPIWSAMRDQDGQFKLKERLMLAPSDLHRPELRDRHILQIEGGDVTTSVRLFWRRDNDSEVIQRFKEALDFAEIK